MRIAKIEISRFLGFDHLEIEVDPNLQLIAGPNNAGKSSIVNLLETFFSSPSGDRLRELLPLNPYYAALGSRTLSSIQVWFSELNADERRKFGDILRQDGLMWLELRCSRAGNVQYKASRKVTADVAQELYKELLNSFYFVKIPSVRIAQDGAEGNSQSLERFLDTLEGVLIRKGATRSTNLQQEFASAMAPINKLVTDVLNDSAKAISTDLPFREQQVQFRLPEPRFALRGMLESAQIESKGDVTVSVAARGTGFQSALVLGILRYVASREAGTGGNLVFAIEEPEAFLHPQTQRAMAKIIEDVSGDAQVLVTTHSAVLVDSFDISRIARLPLSSNGMKYAWKKPVLEKGLAGRLSRYCNAANSELVFANCVILVEGESDFLALEKLLSHLCGATGGHYALGITVIELEGIGKVKHLAGLARHFGVQYFVIADKDSVRKSGGERTLVKGLSSELVESKVDLNALCNLADVDSRSIAQAIANQKEINDALKPVNAFVMSSDLEGLFLDTLGVDGILKALGPDGEKQIDSAFQSRIESSGDGISELRSWMGSKGWNTDGKPSGKLQPHLSAVLMEKVLANKKFGATEPLVRFVKQIVEAASRAPL